jgi:hypothetical protein
LVAKGDPNYHPSEKFIRSFLELNQPPAGIPEGRLHYSCHSTAMLADKKGQLQCQPAQGQVSGNDTARLGSFNRNKRPILVKVNSKIELT